MQFSRTDVKKILDQIKSESFVENYEASDCEAMGLLLSKYFEYDGLDVLKSCSFGLEDCNFHGEVEKINEMVSEIEKKG